MQIRPRHIWLMLAAAAIGIGVGTIGLSDWFRLDPCHLCIFQRFILLVFGGLALAAAWTINHRVPGAIFAALSIGAAMTGASAAAYQIWIQMQPLGGSTCTAGEHSPIELLVEWLGQQLPSLFLATGFCEDDSFQLLGMSLANWSFICFATLTILATWTFWKSRSERDR